MCDKCGTLHLSNMSVRIQYGDDFPITVCICECHLQEQSLHGESARAFQKAHLNIGEEFST